MKGLTLIEAMIHAASGVPISRRPLVSPTPPPPDYSAFPPGLDVTVFWLGGTLPCTVKGETHGSLKLIGKPLGKLQPGLPVAICGKPFTVKKLAMNSFTVRLEE